MVYTPFIKTNGKRRTKIFREFVCHCLADGKRQAESKRNAHPKALACSSAAHVSLDRQAQASRPEWLSDIMDFVLQLNERLHGCARARSKKQNAGIQRIFRILGQQQAEQPKKRQCEQLKQAQQESTRKVLIKYTENTKQSQPVRQKNIAILYTYLMLSCDIVVFIFSRRLCSSPGQYKLDIPPLPYILPNKL